MPRTWSTAEFASHVQKQGLAIVTAETFSVEEGQPHAVRVSLGAARSRSELVSALEIVASLVETCKIAGVEPHAYLATAISRIVNGHPQSRLDDLLPWAYPARPDLKAVA